MRVAIVGAGITGSYLGWKLAEGGEEVVIFEKKGTIGKSVCSGLISERIWNYAPKTKELIENVIKHADIHFPKKTVRVNFRPSMYVISRPKLDAYFAAKAERAGAKILKDHEVRKLFYFKGHKPQISVQSSNHTHAYEFDYIIGCDGPNSVIRRELDLEEPKMRLGIILYENKRNKSDSVDIWPTKNGFIWKLPRGRKTEYGIVENIETAAKEFRTFCKKNRLKSKQAYSSLIPQGLVTSFANRLALCGDAAGLTKPWSGGGVVWGLKTVDIMLGSFPNIKKYNRRIDRFFSPKIFYSKLAEKVVIFAGNNAPWLLPSKTTIDSDWVF